MKALSMIGIVDVSVGSGAFVADGATSVLTKPLAWALLMGEKDARDLSEARQAIEGQLAALAAERATAEELAAIGARLGLMQANLDDAEAFTRYDLEFHLEIARAAHSEVLYRVVQILRHLLHHWFLEVYSRVEEKRSFVALHTPIYEAILARDAEVARRAMIEHLDNGLVRLLDSLHRAERVVNENRDLILGIKVRMDPNATRGTGLAGMRRARELADRVQMPLMTHIAAGPPPLRDIVELMRPGDILTHCFTGQTNRVIDPERRLLPYVKELWERGMAMDIGHGTGSFSFEVAEAMLAHGLPPDVISTDIHQMSAQGPMYDLPTTMAKFLALGMSLPDVIERATARPARLMGQRGLGTLTVGGPADVAAFRLREGDITFYDAQMGARRGHVQLDNTLTVVGGRQLARVPERPPHSFVELPEHQRAVGPRP
jgi:DNA-binding FadR family transcriptional regulator